MSQQTPEPPVGAGAVPALVPPVIRPAVPIARRVVLEQEDRAGAAPAGPAAGPGPDPGPVPGPGAATGSGPVPPPGPAGGPVPPVGPFTFCRNDFREGCWSIVYQPDFRLVTFRGTVRVDRSDPDAGADGVILSGDLYSRPIVGPLPAPDTGVDAPGGPAPADDAGVAGAATVTGDGGEAGGRSGDAAGRAPSAAAAASRPGEVPGAAPFPRRRVIPVFPRNEYHSYLKGTRLSVPQFAPPGRPCSVTLDFEQFDYTQPAPGTFKGSFPAAPSRTVRLSLNRVRSPFPFLGTRYTGRWTEGGVDRGAVTLTWVSRFFRQATVEIDTLLGAVAPQPVPDGAGGTEYFDTIYAKHGWQLTVVTDEVDVPVPSGVTPTDCWSSGNLHNLMSAHRSATTDLDKEWKLHLMVVPAQLGCGRGVMYDQIDVPREGCASFSDDGYPSGDSPNFLGAENRKQRDVPRAFLRSATHEITHTFNQIHQEQETTADNSIMTTTPSVADVLGGPTTGEPGVFPDQIQLAVNTNVRHHLNHMPDPVIRPGGWPFATWFGDVVPQAGDRHEFDRTELELTVTAGADRIALGQPLDLAWTLTNRGAEPLLVPLDLRLEALFAAVVVTDAEGRRRPFRPFVIECESARIGELDAGGSVSASARVFWSSEGFAFPRAGVYTVTVAVTWSAHGVPVGVSGDRQVFVDFPTTDADNEASALVLHPEVGKWVALGGDAYHLTEAVRRLGELGGGAADAGDRPAPRLLAGFEDLLP